MRLMIYEKFLESYSDLPKDTQKKVMAFVQKFKTDSTLHSIHLEAIHSFKDKNLRTARVDQKYRAIIHVPSSGDLCHLLWVDNHDEAMAWAENKIFEWNNNTQSYQVYEDIKNEITESINTEYKPFFENFSDEQLLSIGIPYPLLPSVKTINSFDDLESLEQYLPRQAFENIYYVLDGIQIDDVIEEVNEGKLISKNISDQVESFNNQRSFFEVKDDEEIDKLLSGDLRKWKIYLHPSQRNLVKKILKGSYKVSGAAGTGKTVVAMHRLKELSNLTSKNKSILFTTFTRSLVANLKDSLISLNIDDSKYVLSNIHSLIVDLAKQNNFINTNAKIIEFTENKFKENLWSEVVDYMLSEYDIDFLMKEYEEVILFNNIKSVDEYLNVPRIGMERPIGRTDRMIIWEIIEYFIELKNSSDTYFLDEITNLLSDYYSKKDKKPFEHIIADEIQDFSDVELRLLRSMVKEQDNDLFLVGDPLQNIYGKKISFSRAGINIRGKKSTRLKINYRTTEEIKKSALSVIKETEFDNFEGESESRKGYLSLLHGPQPSFNYFSSFDEMLQNLKNTITELVENEIINLNEICIGTRLNSTLKELKKHLHENKIPYYDLPNKVGDKKGVSISTFHNMKGLEYKSVVLFDFSDSTVPYKFYGFDKLTESEKKNYIRSEKALLYVAMTRAIKNLIIMGISNK